MKGTKELRTNKGITLIALVITIIVMLILVGVTISMAVNGGLFDYAGDAVSETNNALKAEQELANGGIEVDGVWYTSINEYLNKDKVETISKTESYVGCYADVDGDGTVDGVIYADLAIGGSGSYNGCDYSYASVPDVRELKDYYVTGTADGDFGNEVDVLTSIGEGSDRFYVMALEDIKTVDFTSFYWYYNAYNIVDNTVPDTSTAFGTGKANTSKIKEYWDAETPYGTQNDKDLWGQIDLNSGWFLPSEEEWVAFGSAFGIYSVWPEVGDGYSSNGLSYSYWSSSSNFGAACAYMAGFSGGNSFCLYPINEPVQVRLSTTF